VYNFLVNVTSFLAKVRQLTIRGVEVPDCLRCLSGPKRDDFQRTIVTLYCSFTVSRSCIVADSFSTAYDAQKPKTASSLLKASHVLSAWAVARAATILTLRSWYFCDLAFLDSSSLETSSPLVQPASLERSPRTQDFLNDFILQTWRAEGTTMRFL